MQNLQEFSPTQKFAKTTNLAIKSVRFYARQKLKQSQTCEFTLTNKEVALPKRLTLSFK
jgi:hypothetical protein